MTAPIFGRCEDFDYLGRVLSIIGEITLSSGDLTFAPVVDRVAHGVFRVSLESDCTLLVDSNNGVVDDPWLALPDRFPGRLASPRQYRVTWRDAERLPTSTTVAAASRRFARLRAGAPAGAYVEHL